MISLLIVIFPFGSSGPKASGKKKQLVRNSNNWKNDKRKVATTISYKYHNIPQQKYIQRKMAALPEYLTSAFTFSISQKFK